MTEQQDGVMPSTFLGTLWRHRLLIILGTLLGLGVGLGLASIQPKIYTAESRVFLSSQAGFNALSDVPLSSDPSRYLDQQAALLTSGPLLTRALALGATGPDVEELKSSLEVVASAASDVLTVRATGDTATSATSRVDATIASYREYQKAQVTAQLAAVSPLSSADEKRAANQRAAAFGDGVELVEQASVTSTTSALRNATVLAVAGALISSAIGFGLSARDTRRRSRSPRREADDQDDTLGAQQPLGAHRPEVATSEATAPPAGVPVGSRTP